MCIRLLDNDDPEVAVQIRSVVAATVGAVVVALLVPAPAGADTRVPVLGALPSGLSAVQVGCDGATRPAGDLEPAAYAGLEHGPPGTPLHVSSLHVAGDDARQVGLAVEVASSADLAVLRLSSYQQPALRVTVRTADGWQDPASAVGTYRSGWWDIDASGLVPPDLGPVTVLLSFGVCTGGPQAATVDALAFGPAAGHLTTYDFESDSVRLDGVTASRVDGARERAVTCTLHAQEDPFEGLQPVAGQPIVVEARRYGQTEFQRIGTALTDRWGGASVRDRPRRDTAYRCRYAGNDGTTAPPSGPKLTRASTVRVGTDLTIRARRTAHGRRVLVTGVADPLHPGARVVLRAKRVARDAPSRVLARGRLSHRGTYRLSAPLGAGPWQLYVAVARAPGNAAGTSAVRAVR